MPNILHVKRNFYQDDFSMSHSRYSGNGSNLLSLVFAQARKSRQLLFDNTLTNISAIPQELRNQIALAAGSESSDARILTGLPCPYLPDSKFSPKTQAYRDRENPSSDCYPHRER